MATTGTVRKVKQEARLRRSHQHQSPAHRMPPNTAEVDGYGPYKPVPPPKPLPAYSGGGCYSPPPYRMPPYPLYGETAIPGAADSANNNTSGLHTHSNKFPIEREVILSSADKNSKIPILHEYKKRPKSATAAIAPEGPSKQLAWIEEKKADALNGGNNPVVLTRLNQHTDVDSMGMEEMAHHIYKAHPMQMHDSRPKATHPQSATSDYRPPYRGASGTSENPYLYNGHLTGVSTGAVPRNWSGSNARLDDGQIVLTTESSRSRNPPNYASQATSARPPSTLPSQQHPVPTVSSEAIKRDPSTEKKKMEKGDGEDESNSPNSSDILSKDGVVKDSDKSKAFSSRTLHTIKDMISSRFGSGKVLKDANGENSSEDKVGETGQNISTTLNNITGVNGEMTNGTSRKVHGRKEEGLNGQSVSNTDEFEMAQRQHVLGGGPQVIGPSRNYGDLHVMNGAYQKVVANGDIGEGFQTVRAGGEGEEIVHKSGRGNGDQGLCVSTRINQQEHPNRNMGEYTTREFSQQAQEPLYNYHGNARHQQFNKGGGNSRLHQNYGSQPGLLDQNGIYMVMRQNGANLQQQYQQASAMGGPTGSYSGGIQQANGGYSGKDGSHQECGQRTDHETQQINGAVGVGGGNDNRRQGVGDVRALQDRESVRALGDHSATGYNSTRDMSALTKREGGNFGGRRGSQQHVDEDDDEGGFVIGGGNPGKNLRGSNRSEAGENFTNPASYNQQQSSSQSSDYEKATQRSTGQSSSNADSGRGSTIYSSGHQLPAGKRGEISERLDTSTESSDSPQAMGSGHDGIYGVPSALSAGNDSEWVDIVESELRQILDPKLHSLCHQAPPPGANSTLSESISSLTPPLPPLSPGGGSSPAISPRNSTRYKLSASLPYGSKLDYNEALKHGDGRKTSQSGAISKAHHSRGTPSLSNHNSAGNRGAWGGRNNNKNILASEKHRQMLMMSGTKKNDSLLGSSGKGGKMPLSASVFGLDTTDLTSTTTGLDSMLDGNTENNSSDDDLSTTIDTTDAHAIRKQLEGLENMYSEVLKLLGVKKYGGRYQPSDPRVNKRRLYGSMSSLPSSVSSRPVRDKRRQDERKKVKDIKGINKRFQRLESHVVTLARSVAHLSSEMRTQHLMIQEMENIRSEISALRSQTLAVRSQSVPRGLNNVLSVERDATLPALTNPARVKKLTKFFGDEPPLLRLFLKKLGYEKYAGSFENERVGMVELPYLTEERLQKMGIPLGPRLRILQEAQISVCKDKVYVL